MANPAAEARAKVQANYPGATVVERTPNGIKHNIGPNKFALDVGIGPMHYGVDQEIDTAWEAAVAPWTWQMVKAGFNCYAKDYLDAATVARYTDPNTGEYVELDPQNLQYSNDRGDIELIAVPDSVLGTVSDDTVTWTDGYGPGRSFLWQAQTARLHKELILESGSLPAVPQFIRDGGNPVLELAVQIRKSSSAVGLYVNGVLWDEKTSNPQETAEYIEWRIITTQQVLWHFNLPRSWDSSGTPDGQVIGKFTIKKQGPSLYISHRVPLSWIEDAARVWPIMVDVDVDEQIGAAADDCGGRLGSPDFWLTGFPDHPQAGDYNATLYDYYGGSRFQTVAISNGATINVANWRLTAYSLDGTIPATRIDGEDVDDSATFSTAANFLARARTTATVTWTPSAWATNTEYASDDISAIIQEIVVRGSWASGNDLSLFWRYVTAGWGGTMERVTAYSYDGSTTKAPKLHIEYTAGAAGPAGLKTVNELAKANVKTIEGLAIASVKTWNGLA